MGFYPVDPASGVYVLGVPMFEYVSMDVGKGKKFVVSAENFSASNYYIQAVKLNGQPYSKTFIPHEKVIEGGELTFVMGSEPNKNYGKAMEDRPPSFV